MKILFAVDLTEPESVTRAVERLVQRMDGELLVLHVSTPTAMPPIAPVDPMTGLTGFAPYSTYDPSLQQNIEQAREHAFHAFLVERFNMPIRAALRTGEAAQAILDDADDHDVDLIVMGKRHQSSLERFLLGSIASSVLKRTTIPLLLMPIPEEEDA